jgi:AbrB family looped-hinge helix DNA binding protein
MQTKVSTKGQVVVPNRIRRKLNLRPGDVLEAKLEGECIVLVPQRSRPRNARIIQDPGTRLPVLSSGPNAPKLTSEYVRELLADFP